MAQYVWHMLGGLMLVIATIGLMVLKDRARAKGDAGLTPDQLKRKKALEKMADNIGSI